MLEKNDVASDRILPASWRQYSARRLANSASKLGSGFRTTDEILGGFPIFMNAANCNTRPTQGQNAYSTEKSATWAKVWVAGDGLIS